MSSNSYRRMVDINGKTVMIPQDDGAGHKNPPLHEMNASAKETSEALRKRRHEMSVEQLHAAERRRSGRGEKRILATPPRPEYHGTAVPK
jgi:hypothetical protein